MYDPVTGRFEQGNIQDWQHAAMYAAFICSGITDLAGFYTAPGTLPQGTEHVSPHIQVWPPHRVCLKICV